MWSGTGAITVITSESRHYLQSSLPGLENARPVLGNAATLRCPSLSPPFFFPSYSSLPLCELARIYIFLFPAARAHVHIFTPYLVLFVKAEFVPVGWKSNEGKSRCYCAAVDCAPPTPPSSFPPPLPPPPPPHRPSLLTVSPKQDRCSVCMLPAFPASIFLPGIPDYCSICLIAVSERLLFVQRDVLEVGRIHPKCPCLKNANPASPPRCLCG